MTPDRFVVVVARIMRRIDKDGPIHPYRPELGPCWPWLGATNDAGYGQIRVSEGVFYVHRVLWEDRFGPIPDGKLILHSCDNPPCGNPDHTFPGTHHDNTQDMVAKGRAQTGGKLTEQETEEIKFFWISGELRPSPNSAWFLGSKYGVGANHIAPLCGDKFHNQKRFPSRQRRA